MSAIEAAPGAVAQVEEPEPPFWATFVKKMEGFDYTGMFFNIVSETRRIIYWLCAEKSICVGCALNSRDRITCCGAKLVFSSCIVGLPGQIAVSHWLSYRDLNRRR